MKQIDVDGFEAVEDCSNFKTVFVLILNPSLAPFVVVFYCLCSD
jgi:hypothetical protein